MLHDLDARLIERVFEPAAHWFQWRFGVTCFALARVLLHIAAVMWILMLYRLYWPMEEAFDGVMLGWGIVGLTFHQLLLWRSRHLEQRYTQSSLRSKNGDALNPILTIVRISMAFLVSYIYLLAILLLAASFLGGEIDNSNGLFFAAFSVTATWVALYFLVCTPQPPEAQRERIGKHAWVT